MTINPRPHHFYMRITAKEKYRLTLAASLLGLPLASFIREAALKAAQHAIINETICVIQKNQIIIPDDGGA